MIPKAREITPQERRIIDENFAPFAYLEHLYFLSGPSKNYNCIAYSVGITDQWIDPPQRENLDHFYSEHGFTPSISSNGEIRQADATICVWANNDGVTHASRRQLIYTPIPNEKKYLWTSKLGEQFVVTHTSMDLRGGNGNGGVYGQPIRYYK